MAARLSDMLTDFLQDDKVAPGVKIGLINLTPEIALDFQKRLPKRQRKRSDRVTEKYNIDMLAKQWPFLADVIRFNKDDEMIDGQHRVQSVIDTGATIPTLVAFNLEPDAIVPMDSGRGRTFTNYLEMEEHVENVSHVAAMTRRTAQWMVGNYGQENIARVANPEFLGVSMSNGQLVTVYKPMKHQLILATKEGLAFSRYFRKSAGPAIFGFSWMIFGAIDIDAREKFFYELKNGAAINGPEQPMNQLRNFLQKQWLGQKKPTAWEWQHYFFQTWNRVIEGSTTGLRRPSFPAWNTVGKPLDPHAALREPGWEPIPNVFAELKEAA